MTVFAPTNEALQAAGIDPLNVNEVSEILKFHVVPGVAAYSTDLAEGSQTVPTLQGSQLLVKKSMSGVTVNNANVIVPDVASSNGVVHVIDRVLIPPDTIRTRSGSLSLEQARAMIVEAIDEGVALFNSGDIQGCADVYLSAATTVASMLPAGASKDILEAAIEASGDKSAITSAWLLRAAFDSVRSSELSTSSIVENAVAASGDGLSTLVSVLTMPSYAPVLQALSGNGPFTVFAPTDDAFQAAGVDVSDVAGVTEVLKYHVIPGVAAYSVGLASSQAVPTLQGDTVQIRTMNNNRAVLVDDASVVIPNILASNGVIRVIDGVLLPSTGAVEYSTLQSVIDRLEEAISVGAPLFDAGDQEGCKQIYLAAARELVAANAPMSTTLQTAITTASSQNGFDGSWTLRRAFDSIIDAVPTTTATSTRGGGFTSSITSAFDISPLPWEVINDTVMGGVSRSTVNVMNGIVNFMGYVTTDSNGGFATARAMSRNPINLLACSGVAFEAMGSGGRHQFSIRNSRNWAGGEFEMDFYPTTQWQEFTVRFNEVSQNFMGQSIPGRLDASQIYGFGLKKSAFLNGLQKDPAFRNGNFNV